ncbi:TraR/DksA C4-type zinc finger protein [Kribbella sp. NPDC048915]|uniref:TraR/DksA family transcriptional regulator n=1 Tax=Kribbella sp. NPDC048915 TaxID=3155148 RepID=UPI00340CCA10
MRTTPNKTREAAPPSRVEETLQQLRHERESRLAQLSAMDADAADAADGELASVQATAIRRVLAEIDAAEERALNGTYGVCLGCDARIPVGRLEILPYVRYCVRCQQRAL